MAFIFVCGTHTFTNPLKGYEHITVQCQNCGNWSAQCYSRWEWFTFCFVPIIPFSFKPWHEVGCRICNFWQDLQYRPDIQAQQHQAVGPPPGSGGQMPRQGWGGGPGGGPSPEYYTHAAYGSPPGGPNHMEYHHASTAASNNPNPINSDTHTMHIPNTQAPPEGQQNKNDLPAYR